MRGDVTFSSFGLTFLTELLAGRYGTISPGTVESECATSYRVPHCTGHQGKNSLALEAFGGFLMQHDITVQIAGFIDTTNPHKWTGAQSAPRDNIGEIWTSGIFIDRYPAA